MAISLKKLHKIILTKLSYNQQFGHLKIYHKNMFNYPKNNTSKKFKFETYNNIKKDIIDKYVIDMLTDKSFKNCKVIHPYLIAISWHKLNKQFLKVKKCESSNCNEVIPIPNLNQPINYKIQTRETLKITCLLLGNKLFEENFPEYYNYLLSDRGITIEEKIDINLPTKNRWVDIKFSFDEKINIYLEINEKHHDKVKDLYRANEIFSNTNTMPILYYQNEEDMTNLLPKIYLELCYAIAKVDIYQALKFYLIIIDKLDPFFVNFSINNMECNKINISDINNTLKEYGMKEPRKYIKRLIADNLLDDTEIDYEDTDIMKGTITQIGCDIIFMRLDNKLFKGTNNNSGTHLCKQYSIIKQKYFKNLELLLTHQQHHFKIIYENKIKLEKLYKEIKPMNKIIPELLEKFYINSDKDDISLIKKELNLELHPKHCFLVRQDGLFTDGNTFKKISKAKYHNSEETSNNIINYRMMKLSELNSIKELL